MAPNQPPKPAPNPKAPATRVTFISDKCHWEEIDKLDYLPKLPQKDNNGNEYGKEENIDTTKIKDVNGNRKFHLFQCMPDKINPCNPGNGCHGSLDIKVKGNYKAICECIKLGEGVGALQTRPVFIYLKSSDTCHWTLLANNPKPNEPVWECLGDGCADKKVCQQELPDPKLHPYEIKVLEKQPKGPPKEIDGILYIITCKCS